ncbi:MAG: hypothetical protein WBW04_06785 [Nitrolancea sp.]
MRLIEEDALHPHARQVAKSRHLPEARLAYLDDPDEIDELARIMVRRRERRRRRWLRIYFMLFYGGTGLLVVVGLLLNVAFIAGAVLWLILLLALGLIALKPAD